MGGGGGGGGGGAGEGAMNAAWKNVAGHDSDV